MLEGRVVRQRMCRHSNLLARAWRAGGLWSAASGEEVTCLELIGRSGGSGPFRGLEAPRARTATLADQMSYVLEVLKQVLAKMDCRHGQAGEDRWYGRADHGRSNICLAGCRIASASLLSWVEETLADWHRRDCSASMA